MWLQRAVISITHILFVVVQGPEIFASIDLGVPI
jgi:hypothetical protein